MLKAKWLMCSGRKVEIKAGVCFAAAAMNGFTASFNGCVKVLAVWKRQAEQCKKTAREWGEWRASEQGKKLQREEVSGNSFHHTSVPKCTLAS